LQIVREAISNAARHAHAHEITVKLHRRGGFLYAMVADDGRGFDTERVLRRTGSGLNNMQARAESLQARLTIDSRPGDGTMVGLRVPLPSEA
jgi:signal transduction histidine kinase